MKKQKRKRKLVASLGHEFGKGRNERIIPHKNARRKKQKARNEIIGGNHE
jgi:hypothetical protein